jgi:hypothetical protein
VKRLFSWLLAILDALDPPEQWVLDLVEEHERQ